MICSARLLVLTFVTTFLAAACPEPEAIGHAPKAQVDMAKERLDKATDKMTQGLDEATKAVDDNK